MNNLGIIRADEQSGLLKSIGTALLLTVLMVGGCLAVAYGLINSEENRGPFLFRNTVADLDGDGDLDVVVHAARFETEMTVFSGVTLYFNTGDGKFIRVVPEMGSAGADAADVDGDGDVDIVTLASDQLTVFLNQGGARGTAEGVFKRNKPILPPVKVPEGLGMMGSLTLGDLNNDGLPDGFAAGCCGISHPQLTSSGEYAKPFSWVWINRWDSKEWAVLDTQALPFLDGVPVAAAVFGDLDGDGVQDVYAAVRTPKPGRSSDPGDRVLLNDGAGNLRDSRQRLGAYDSTSAALGDVDGDGDLDALVGTPRGAVVWLNQGEGKFQEAEKNLPGKDTGAVFLHDLDGDGDLNALLGGSRQAAVWWNDGRGDFNQAGPSLSISDREGLALGDFNGDGRTDVFIPFYGGGYRVWWNEDRVTSGD